MKCGLASPRGASWSTNSTDGTGRSVAVRLQALVVQVQRDQLAAVYEPFAEQIVPVLRAIEWRSQQPSVIRGMPT
jgi:hypothetical protein